MSSMVNSITSNWPRRERTVTEWTSSTRKTQTKNTKTRSTITITWAKITNLTTRGNSTPPRKSHSTRQSQSSPLRAATTSSLVGAKWWWLEARTASASPRTKAVRRSMSKESSKTIPTLCAANILTTTTASTTKRAWKWSQTTYISSKFPATAAPKSKSTR